MTFRVKRISAMVCDQYVVLGEPLRNGEWNMMQHTRSLASSLRDFIFSSISALDICPSFSSIQFSIYLSLDGSILVLNRILLYGRLALKGFNNFDSFFWLLLDLNISNRYFTYFTDH